MNDSHLVAFRKVGTQVQLIALNMRYFAQPKTPQALGVREAFSDSLLASVPVVSQPHPERKSVLIEVNALLLADIPGANGDLERDLPAVVLVRRAQLEHHQGALDAGADVVQRQRPLLAVARDPAAGRRRARRRPRRRRRPCPTSAACSSAGTTTSPSCPTSRCPRASPTTASAISAPGASTTPTTTR